MAIEDGYQLAFELDNAWQQSAKSGSTIDIASSLKSYERERRLRVTFVHGMARMAALMASTYKAYLGVGLGPFEFLTKFRIPHPGRVGGRFFIQKSMPLMLNWVLGGNSSKLEGRPLCCRLSDKASDQLHTWFEDDDALERTINGEWILLPCGDVPGHVKPISLNQDDTKPYIIGNTSAMSIEQEDYPGSLITIPLPQVSQLHARINFKDGAFFLTDLRSQHGTWITDNEGRRYMVSPNYPARIRPSHVIEFGCNQASYRVKVTRSAPRVAQKEGAQILQKV